MVYANCTARDLAQVLNECWFPWFSGRVDLVSLRSYPHQEKRDRSWMHCLIILFATNQTWTVAYPKELHFFPIRDIISPFSLSPVSHEGRSHITEAMASGRMQAGIFHAILSIKNAHWLLPLPPIMTSYSKHHLWLLSLFWEKGFIGRTHRPRTLPRTLPAQSHGVQGQKLLPRER